MKMKNEVNKAIKGLKSFHRELFDEEETRFGLERLLEKQENTEEFVYSGVELELKDWKIYVWFKGPNHKKIGLIFKEGAFKKLVDIFEGVRH